MTLFSVDDALYDRLNRHSIQRGSRRSTLVEVNVIITVLIVHDRKAFWVMYDCTEINALLLMAIFVTSFIFFSHYVVVLHLADDAFILEFI